MVDDTPPGLPRLSPLPYLQQVVQWLQRSEPEVWRWALSAQAREEHAQAVRADLLKQTYRLDADAHPALHAHCTAAAARLGLAVPVTLYQGQDGGAAMNASLYFVPGEAHVVFSGPLLERLAGPELEAVLGHELAHHLLWSLDEGAFHAADRILSATAADPRSAASHDQTARRYRLYTEAFADRGSAVACGALAPAVVALVKTQTGLATVSAASYLRQADEACAAQGSPSAGPHSHPEVFVRARALRLWCESDPQADAWLASQLDGPLSLDTLDVCGQQRVHALTRRVIADFLQPAWLRSDTLLAHARRFFPDVEPASAPDATLAEELAPLAGLHPYVAALLLDFSACDPALEDVPLAAALQMAERLGAAADYERLALKALGLTKRQFNKHRQGAAALLQRTAERHG